MKKHEEAGFATSHRNTTSASRIPLVTSARAKGLLGLLTECKVAEGNPRHWPTPCVVPRMCPLNYAQRPQKDLDQVPTSLDVWWDRGSHSDVAPGAGPPSSRRAAKNKIPLQHIKVLFPLPGALRPTCLLTVICPRLLISPGAGEIKVRFSETLANTSGAALGSLLR